MRLFAAIDLPDAQRADLRRALSDAGLPSRGIRVAPEEQWHLTVAFFGEVADRIVPDLTDRLERAVARTPAMTLALTGAGTFPAQANLGRVLWVGVSGDLEVLGRLAQRCAAAGRRCGLAMDKVRYRPHLTVGRSRGTPTDMNSASGALSGFSGEQWRITSVELVHSTLGAEVRHDTIATLPLS